MASKKQSFIWPSARLNNATFNYYYYRLKNIAISSIGWEELPATVNERFIELTLYDNGQAIFFRDDILGFLGLQCMGTGEFNVYNIPTKRTAYATSGAQWELTDENSVIIYDNYLHTVDCNVLRMFAYRLYEIERAIDVNVKQQKTPCIIRCEESQRLTLKNLFMQYEGNEPFIYGSKKLDLSGISVLNTQAPFVASDLQTLKRQIFNEALTYLGVENGNTEKKERLVTGEITSNLGGVEAQRYSRLAAREAAAKEINDMFGLNIKPYYRQEFLSLKAEDFLNE